MDEHGCPDCDVTMKETTVETQTGGELSVDPGEQSAVLEKVGMNASTAVESVRCPKCGLVRLYAATE